MVAQLLKSPERKRVISGDVIPSDLSSNFGLDAGIEFAV